MDIVSLLVGKLREMHKRRNNRVTYGNLWNLMGRFGNIEDLVKEEKGRIAGLKGIQIGEHTLEEQKAHQEQNSLLEDLELKLKTLELSKFNQLEDKKAMDEVKEYRLVALRDIHKKNIQKFLWG